MLIRPYTSMDLESMLSVADKFIHEHILDEDWHEFWLNRDNYPKLTDFGYDVLIAHNHPLSNIVGFIIGAGHSEHKGIYEIRHNYVIPRFRGFGIGKAQKRALTDLAYNSGYNEMWSDVAKYNYASLRLNEGLGWERTELDEDTWRFKYYLRKV